MIDLQLNLSLMILLVGAIIVLAILTKSVSQRMQVPALVGYIVIGFLLRMADVRWEFLSEGARVVFEFLAKIGVITLLFRIGLESNVAKLLRRLRRASTIWIGDVLFSGGLGFVVCFFLLGFALIPSLFVAIALSATSVGVSVGVWHDANAVNSPTGELLLDVAELDDISGIVLMALLFAVVPVLKEGTQASITPILLKTGGLILLKLVAFGGLCAVFSLYLERRITDFFKRIESPPNFMLLVAGIGFIMAALAGWLGFSVAIGAFFAGLAFSRDPESVKIDASFGPLYELFSPFFFIGIGLSIDPGTMTSALGLGLLLLMAAAFGKLFGDGTPAFITVGGSGALLVGVSMMPRAEIAMIVMQRGLSLGEWAVPSRVFGAMVVVSAATCIISPIIVRSLLRRWPQQEEGGS